MINFFRKIRQQLAYENNVSKYLRYAIGEIVLVVIGILIALYINNLNVVRKENQNYLSILQTIKENMVVDTTAIGTVVREYNKIEYAFLLSKKDTISMEEYLNCEDCPTIMAGFSPFYMKRRGYNQFLNTITNIKVEGDSLNSTIDNFYSDYIYSTDLAVESTVELFSELYNISRESYAWFKDWNEGTYTDEFYEFVLHDPIYKNRVSQYYLYIYQFYLRILNQTKENEEAVLQLIDQKLASAKN